MHDWIDLALGVIVSACGGLVLRLLSHIDSLEAQTKEHSEEIRDTRSAVARIEGHCGLDPFPYKN